LWLGLPVATQARQVGCEVGYHPVQHTARHGRSIGTFGQGLIQVKNDGATDIPQFGAAKLISWADIPQDAIPPLPNLFATIRAYTQTDIDDDDHTVDLVVLQTHIAAGEYGLARFRGLTLVRAKLPTGVSTGYQGTKMTDPGHVVTVTELQDTSIQYQSDTSINDTWHDILWGKSSSNPDADVLALVNLGGYPPSIDRGIAI